MYATDLWQQTAKMHATSLWQRTAKMYATNLWQQTAKMYATKVIVKAKMYRTILEQLSENKKSSKTGIEFKI